MKFTEIISATISACIWHAQSGRLGSAENPAFCSILRKEPLNSPIWKIPNQNHGQLESLCAYWVIGGIFLQFKAKDH